MHPNILIIIGAESCVQSITDKGHHSLHFGQPVVCVPAAENPWANWISFLTSTFPSHHQVHHNTDPVGLHAYLLPDYLKSFGYDSIIICSPTSHKFGHKGNFSHIADSESLLTSKIDWDFLKKSDSKPRLMVYLSPETSSSNDNQNLQYLIDEYGYESTIICTIHNLLESFPRSIDTQKLQVKFYGKSKFASQLNSVVDIVPTLLAIAGIKPHSAYIGKNLINPKHPRTSALYEHADGSKTLITAEYSLHINPTSNVGEIFRLNTRSTPSANLWDDPTSQSIKEKLLLQFLWAQLDKEVMPMPRVSGA